jgi:uncharacterized membrane-anchored protein YitT (DUF2179 family)
MIPRRTSSVPREVKIGATKDATIVESMIISPTIALNHQSLRRSKMMMINTRRKALIRKISS